MSRTSNLIANNPLTSLLGGLATKDFLATTITGGKAGFIQEGNMQHYQFNFTNLGGTQNNTINVPVGTSYMVLLITNGYRQATADQLSLITLWQFSLSSTGAVSGPSSTAMVTGIVPSGWSEILTVAAGSTSTPGVITLASVGTATSNPINWSINAFIASSQL